MLNDLLNACLNFLTISDTGTCMYMVHSAKPPLMRSIQRASDSVFLLKKSLFSRCHGVPCLVSPFVFVCVVRNFESGIL